MRIYVIGDVHGRLDLLERLHDRIMSEIARDSPDDWRIVLVGDYCDRGPDVHGTIDFLIEKSSEPRIVPLLGNHDQGFLDFLDRPDLGVFALYGGEQTARSYGVELETRTHDAMRKGHAELLAAVPGEHRAFLEKLALTAEFGDFFICHAGIRPGVPLAKQEPKDLLWIRSEFLDCPKLHDKVIVHGHTPCERPELLPNRVNVDTGAVWSGVLTAFVVDDGEKRLLEEVGKPAPGYD